MSIENIEAKDLAVLMAHDEVLLIDVREPSEFAAERIAGAELRPLSKFDPFSLPDPSAKKIVFFCAGGVRSARAVAACQRAGLPHRSHLRGGLAAWKAAGLPTQGKP